MAQLDDMVPMYKREVAPLGQYDAMYPGVVAADILGALADGFAQAQLEGFFATTVLDGTEFTPELSRPAEQLVVIFAGMRTLRTQLQNLKGNVRYKAGPVEYETQQSASVLTELLKDSRARRDAILEAGRRGSGPTDYILDYYALRAAQPYGFYAGELPVAAGGL